MFVIWIVPWWLALLMIFLNTPGPRKPTRWERKEEARKAAKVEPLVRMAKIFDSLSADEQNDLHQAYRGLTLAEQMAFTQANGGLAPTGQCEADWKVQEATYRASERLRLSPVEYEAFLANRRAVCGPSYH